MKSPIFPSAVFFAAVLGFAGTLPAVETGVSVRVEQQNKSDMNPKNLKNRTYTRSLAIFVTNNTAEPLDLKVKHVIFGRDMIHKDFVTVDEGEKPLTVKPHATEKIETAEAKSTASEEHYDAKSKKKVPASGASIVGSGVQVLKGTQVMDEFYDPASMKEHWGKTIKPAPAAAKK